MSKIFLNYRRDDTAGFAGRLYDRLVTKFGEESIFRDIDSIEPGARLLFRHRPGRPGPVTRSWPSSATAG